MQTSQRYVLITAARNEGLYIENTIASVRSQTVPPAEWIIVSDGSTDDTDTIVSRHQAEHPFIRLLRKDAVEGRNFSSKVMALRSANENLRTPDYRYIGNLDADVRFEPDYYARMIREFEQDPSLGIVGGTLYDREGGAGFRKQRKSKSSVGGPIQFFRRECWEAVGGYLPIRCGSEDGVAEVTARMLGWGVRSCPDVVVHHLRATGTQGKRYWAIRWNEGEIEHAVGYHPVFHAVRGAQRLFEKPVVIGSFIRSANYFRHCLMRTPRPVSQAYIRFTRQEQMRKLGGVLMGMLKGRIEY
jgi:cellulose synthase/poly-beta-1,6-N-acetylglucosamine synthase-like glycosyltransferase